MSKKVCMLVFNHFRNDSRVLKEAYTLIENGYQVKVIALWEDGLERSENLNGLEVTRLEINPLHTRLFKRSSEPTSPNVGSSSTLKTDQKSQSSIKSKLVVFTKRFLLGIHKPITYWQFHKAVKKEISGEKFDVFHAHDLNTLYPAYKGAKKHGGKLIYDSHELYIHRNKPHQPSKFYKYISTQFEQYLISQTNAVITVSDSIADFLKSTYKIERPEVIMNAPSQFKDNIEVKSLRQELNISNEFKIAIYSGGITFNRGLEKVIESLTLLPNVYLVLMGYGNPAYLNKLEQIAMKLGVKDRFSFYGPVAPSEVTSYTASADVGIAPIENVCLSYYFCAPNKIFEYINGGIPVVASNFPELSKILRDNNIGYSFDPENVNSISKSVNDIFSDDSEYAEMKKRTFSAAKKYNWENEAKKLIQLYNRI